MMDKIKNGFERTDLDIYKIIWIFTIVAFLGWAIELIWYVIKWDQFVYNQGLVLGPFQQIYGFGAVIITLLASFLKDKKLVTIFIFGFIAFGLFEYLGGLYQEVFTKTYSWDYSRVGYKFVIGKYVYLPYCVVWGIFAVVWTKYAHEKLCNMLNKIITKKFKIISIIIALFFIINIALTEAATNRMVERNNNIEAKNIFDKYIDKVFDDAYMKKWLPKIRIISEN